MPKTINSNQRTTIALMMRVGTLFDQSKRGVLHTQCTIPHGLEKRPDRTIITTSSLKSIKYFLIQHLFVFEIIESNVSYTTEKKFTVGNYICLANPSSHKESAYLNESENVCTSVSGVSVIPKETLR